MATITVFKFDTPRGAGEMLDLVKDLSKQQLITLQDAATVVWEQGKKAPKTKQLASMTGLGALDGAFWGMLFGLIFFVPFFGMAVGAAMGALSGKFTDYGIDDDFIKSVRDKVTEGTSALFLMTSDAVTDKVIAAVKRSGLNFELVTSNLSSEAEDQLRAAFSAE
ncbi:MAG: DUF1269 domain-containing protein [Anaerolineales bacterium]|jgi:uncharacterized membrane protein